MKYSKTPRWLKFLAILGGGLVLNSQYLKYRNKVGYKPVVKHDQFSYDGEPL
jgi:hypothetical protein